MQIVAGLGDPVANDMLEQRCPGGKPTGLVVDPRLAVGRQP
jgi:hypothetical protein